jgi:hypothetical protein
VTIVTDGGDGNWSVATLCFYALLIKLKIIDSCRIYRLGGEFIFQRAEAR